jgi:hypothetical protein
MDPNDPRLPRKKRRRPASPCSQARTVNLFERALLDKSAKGWVSLVQTDAAHKTIAEFFDIQVKHFRKERAKSIEAFLASYNIH